MTARRLFALLCAGTIASASLAAAQPAKKPKAAPKPKAPAPAKDATGSDVQMSEDPAPADLSGTSEDPDSPRPIADPTAPAAVTSGPAPAPRTGYPIEEVSRPINLPQNMSEVAIAPHMTSSPFSVSTALRARYGIDNKLQLGLTYVLGGIYDDPATLDSDQGFHSGKAVGVDVTYMLQSWVGVQVGIPLYISPLAFSLSLGAPFKFSFADKIAIGGLDDLINIKLKKFAPNFYSERQNAINANDTMINTIKSDGELRFSFYLLYQHQPDLAFIGRFGNQLEDFSSGKTDGCLGECQTTFLHAGLRYSPRRFLDVGLTIGFDDLAHGGSFAPNGYLAFRI
jgi:hypothetical protein